ncbi:MAG TPA: 50S ribosomal protein L15 [Chthonomonadales bacterium]|nr:50S ribosomal protein L15 [Chthonomonadales bacterium]
MRLHDLAPAPGSRKRRKTVGRGPGSGHGKTSTRGHKGNKARGQVNPNFEGGQTPLHRRLPQLRGFKPVNRVQYAVVNVGALDGLDSGAEVTPKAMAELGLLRDENERVKVLGDGELTKKLTVRAHKFSASAVAKIEGSGGTAEVL